MDLSDKSLNHRIARAQGQHAYSTNAVNNSKRTFDDDHYFSNSADMGATIDRNKYTTPCHRRQINQRSLKMASVASDD